VSPVRYELNIYMYVMRKKVDRLPNARGYNWSTLFLGEINTGTWPSWLGEV
jgi:hypothetical protein